MSKKLDNLEMKLLESKEVYDIAVSDSKDYNPNGDWENDPEVIIAKKRYEKAEEAFFTASEDQRILDIIKQENKKTKVVYSIPEYNRIKNKNTNY